MDPTHRLASTTVHRCAQLHVAIEEFTVPGGILRQPVIHRPASVAVIAEPGPRLLLLTRRWRPPVARWTLELPGEPVATGEHPQATARRALAASGYRAGQVREALRCRTDPELGDGELFLYRATALERIGARPQGGEPGEPEEVPFATLPRLIAEGAIDDAHTLLAIATCGVAAIGR
jgi:hypothetical protein